MAIIFSFLISEDPCKDTENVAEKCEISKTLVKDKGNVKDKLNSLHWDTRYTKFNKTIIFG